MHMILEAILASRCGSCSGIVKEAPGFLVQFTTSGTRLTQISEDEDGNDKIWHKAFSRLKSRPPKAFLFHKGCWVLLSRHFTGDQLRLERLVEVLQENPGPQEFCCYEPEPSSIRYWQHQKWWRKIAKSIPTTSVHFTSGSAGVKDFFEWIPAHIRFEIVSRLPTVDFLNLRLCSRAIAVLFHSQAFWKTRFFLHGDRGYMSFLTETSDHGVKDWRVLYRCIKKQSEFDGQLGRPDFYECQDLLLRKSHWEHNQWLRDACLMTRSSIQAIDTKSLRWQKAFGKITCDSLHEVWDRPKESCVKCHLKYKTLTQSIPFSPKVVGINFSVFSGPKQRREDTFIAGLELIYPPGTPNATLGYRLPGKQIEIDFDGRPLRGFELAIGEGGIHAIRPLFSAMNSWIGSPGDVRRLFTNDEIVALSVELDYCRLIGLSVGTKAISA